MRRKNEILFITGNESKFNEFKRILKEVNMRRKKIDLPEFQGSPDFIVKEKAKLAAKMTNEPCFVDDTSLFFDDWKNLPGPYIKYFMELGYKKVSSLILKTSKNHKAKAVCSIGYCEPKKKPVCIQGIASGKIVSPKGNPHFLNGWDPIFLPQGCKKTYAEMAPEEKDAVSHRMKAIRKLEKFLRTKHFKKKK